VDDFISCQKIPLKKFSKGKEVENGSSPNGKLSSLKANMGEGKGRKISVRINLWILVIVLVLCIPLMNNSSLLNG
jgi:hypothetical protein